MITLASIALAQSYSFPTSASDYGHFYPTTYVDNNGYDYTCGTDRYSGHQGTDFGAGSWAGMAAGRDITAAADGIVEYVHDGERDDCSLDCSSGANVVQIRHPDGRLSFYVHLKKWSIQVSVGDAVYCGDKIGEMGSSGYSSAPHLHYAVYDASGDVFDPFEGSCGSANTSWVDQGSYQGLPGRVCDASSPGPGSSGGGSGGCFSSMMSGHLALLLLPPMWGRRRSCRSSAETD